MLRIFLTDDALSSKVPQLTLRIAEGDCIVKFQYVKQMKLPVFHRFSRTDVQCFPCSSGLLLPGDMDAYGVLANCSRCRKGMHRIAFDLFEKRVALKKEEVKVPRTTYVVYEYLTSSFDYIRRIFRTSQIIKHSSFPPDAEFLQNTMQQT